MTQKQTAVMSLAIAFRNWQRDWDRYDKEKINKPLSFDQFITPFLEMEKEQMKDATLSQVTTRHKFRKIFENQFEQYYNETYGSKGSDETKGGELATFKTSSQAEISDEEIKDRANKETSIEWLIKELKLEGYDYTIKVAKKMYDKEIDECSKKHSIQKINPSDFIDEMIKNAGKRD